MTCPDDRRCERCGRPAQKVCDYPFENGRCGRAMCIRHVYLSEPETDTDYCLSHVGQSLPQQEPS